MHGATHLPYDEEDESSAQHQGEHVAEGRKGERHGCASQPDDEMGRERERELAPCSLPLYRLLPTVPPSFSGGYCLLPPPMQAESVSSRWAKPF